MEHNQDKLMSQLNNLIEINNDRVQGYERAAKETKENDLQSLFTEMANHSSSHRMALANEVTKLGGTPTESTRNSGKIFRAWMDVKAALTGKDRRAIISACEFGEDAALETYDAVLKSYDMLPEPIREMIIKQKQELTQDHDRIKALRDAVKS
jgi:uncharacterized protein (TIGR02284 family)